MGAARNFSSLVLLAVVTLSAQTPQPVPAEREKTTLRERLQQRLNLIQPTRETPRGLVVTLNDALFDGSRNALTPPGRERLARITGILLAHPGLKVQLEGHADTPGSEDDNRKLSEELAATVKDYLVLHGLPAEAVTAAGPGKSSPPPTADTAAGHPSARQVDMIVSGAPIGIDPPPVAAQK